MRHNSHLLLLTLFALVLGISCAPPLRQQARQASETPSPTPTSEPASGGSTSLPPYSSNTASARRVPDSTNVNVTVAERQRNVGGDAPPKMADYQASRPSAGYATPSPGPSPSNPAGNANLGTILNGKGSARESAARTSGGSRASARRRTPVPPDIQKLIQQKIDRLEEGQILFNPPTEMRVGVKERVEVRISREAEDDIREGLEGRGEVTIEPIRVDSYMRVKLTGNNFTIEPDPKQEEEQMVRADDYTQWAWDVTPESSGTQKLYVRVAVKATLPEIGEKTIYAQILEKPVVVRVHPYYSTAYFCKKNWQWLLGTIAGSGVLGFSLGRRGKKG